MALRSFPIVTTTRQIQAITVWNPATPWQVYLRKAGSIYQKDGALDHYRGERAVYFAELTSHLGENSGKDSISLARQQMGTRADWLVDRPSIELEAKINGAGNLVVLVHPVRWNDAHDAPTEFTSEYRRKTWLINLGGARPPWELLWLKGFQRAPLICQTSKRARRKLDITETLTEADACLCYAGWALYLQMVERLSESMEVNATPLSQLIWCKPADPPMGVPIELCTAATN